MSQLTIVMYHYVRELTGGRYPGIKGLSVSAFREQLAYLQRHYQIVRMEDCLAALEGGAEARLPPRPALLTFDDGFVDHFTHVLPILEAAGLQGSFFPPGAPVLERRLLGVHKLHFVLAVCRSTELLLMEVFDLLDEQRSSHDLEENQVYYERLAVPGRFDPAEVIFIKRLLQRELERPVREAILAELFRRHIGVDEATFAADLYLSLEQVRELLARGMFVGSHGYQHEWLDALAPHELESELDRSLDLLEAVGAPGSPRVMCYPYGAYDPGVLEALGARSFRAGLTTRVGIADLCPDNALTLERLDTNDLPREGTAPANEWTLRSAQ